MNSYTPETLSRAVAAICPDIQSYVKKSVIFDERKMWWELSCCILSSQVPYPLAVAAANAIDEHGYLYKEICPHKPLVSRLIDVLGKPLSVENKMRSYRFPIARAHQLAATHSTVLRDATSLKALVSSFSNPAKGRDWLVKFAPGMGPKQASMFLRNVGVSYELAILDRHVLSYMSALGIYSGKSFSISGLTQYSHHETALREHARELDCPVGLLDWAIWIVMRVANKNKEPVLI
jgi:N-glycosylase/DNA lyase